MTARVAAAQPSTSGETLPGSVDDFRAFLAALDPAERKEPARRIVASLISRSERERQEWRDMLTTAAKLTRTDFDALLRSARDRATRQGGAMDGMPPNATRVSSSQRDPIYAVADGGPNHGLWRDGERICPLPYLHDVLAIRDAEEVQRGLVYLLSANSRPDTAQHRITDKQLTSGEYIGQLAIPVPEDRPLREAVVTVLRTLASEREPIEATARWENGRLRMPPREALPAGYLSTAGDSASALVAWREIAQLVCQPGAEHGALNMGAGYAAVYVRPMSKVRPVSAALCGAGEPRKGKTTAANIAAGIMGSPLLVNPVVSESPISIGDSLAGLGCLPFFRDEGHSAGWSRGDWKTYWMRTLNGAGRRRSRSDGSGVVRSTPGWWGLQFWSGNFDPRFGATDGVQARVIVTGDPHMPGKPVADRIKDLLGEAYGWPIHWFLADHPTPERFEAEFVRPARDELDALAPAGSGQTVADTLALMVAGAELFGRVLRVPELRAAALRSAKRVLTALAGSLADSSARFDEQLYEAVWNNVGDHPGLWPTKSDYEDSFQGRPDSPTRSPNEVRGVRHTHNGKAVVSMFTAQFNELTGKLDLALDQALSDLQARGVLFPGAKMGYRHKIRIAGLGTRNVYMFLARDDSDQPKADQDTTTGTDEQTQTVPEQRTSEPVPELPAVVELPIPEPAVCGGSGCGFFAGSNASDVLQDGQWWHKECLDGTELALVAPAQVGTPVQVQPAVPRQAPTGTPSRHDPKELATAAKVIRDREGGYPDASDADIAQAYTLFRQVTAVKGLDKLAEGVRMIGDPGFVGVAWFKLLRDGWSGSVTTAELDFPLYESISNGGNMFRFLDHMRPGVEVPGKVALLDVVAAYPNAAQSIDLGHAQPDHYTTARSIKQITSRARWSKGPGAVLLGSKPKLTVPVPALAGWDAGSWVPLPMIDFLLNPWPGRGPIIKGELDIAELLYWHKGNRGHRMENWVEHVRDAEYTLGAMLKQDDRPAVRYALHLVKRVSRAYLGGYARSPKYNPNPELVRYDWYDMWVTTAGANILRKTVRATVEQGAPEPIGIYRDDVWYADEPPAALAHEIVPGKYGKFKVKGLVTVTGDMAKAITDRSAYHLSTALSTGRKEQRA